MENLLLKVVLDLLHPKKLFVGNTTCWPYGSTDGKNIVMRNGSLMSTEFYHYRVEFQTRGAGHIHGVLWIDLQKVEEDLTKEGLIKKKKSLINAVLKLKHSETLDKNENLTSSVSI